MKGRKERKTFGVEIFLSGKKVYADLRYSKLFCMSIFFRKLRQNFCFTEVNHAMNIDLILVIDNTKDKSHVMYKTNQFYSLFQVSSRNKISSRQKFHPSDGHQQKI